MQPQKDQDELQERKLAKLTPLAREARVTEIGNDFKTGVPNEAMRFLGEVR